MPQEPVRRVFEVEVYNDGHRSSFDTKTIEAHSFEESTFGSLTFIKAVPVGDVYVKLIEAYFPAGEIRSMRETTRYEPQLVSLAIN